MKRLLKITSVILIQAFLVMDCAWAGDFSSSARDAATLAPHAQISEQAIRDVFSAYVSPQQILPPMVTVQESTPVEQPLLTRRGFLRQIGGAAVAAALAITPPAVTVATTLLTPQTVSAQGSAIKNPQDLLIGAVNDDVLDRYVSILNDMGQLKEFVHILKDNTILIMLGEHGEDALVWQRRLEARGIRGVKLVSSQAAWEETKSYKVMQEFVDFIATAEKNNGRHMDALRLRQSLESITFIESEFEHWVSAGVLKTSATGAKGVTQLTEKAVSEIARQYMTHKGGVNRVIDLERTLLKQSVMDKYMRRLQDVKGTRDAAAVRAVLQDMDQDKENRLVDVNIFYALAVWEKSGRITSSQANLIEKVIAQTMIKIQADEGSFKPENMENARIQYQQESLRASIVMDVVHSLVSQETIEDDGRRIDISSEKNKSDRKREVLFQRLLKSSENKISNQRIGYLSFWLGLDTFRHLRLIHARGQNTLENAFSQMSAEERGFDEFLAATAAYNGGANTVRVALRDIGSRSWFLHMIGVNEANPREPVNYVRRALEYKLQRTGKLSKYEDNILNQLIRERYKRLRLSPRNGSFIILEQDALTRSGKDYVAFSGDKKKYELLALVARLIGSEKVDGGIIGWANMEKREQDRKQAEAIRQSRLKKPGSKELKAARTAVNKPGKKISGPGKKPGSVALKTASRQKQSAVKPTGMPLTPDSIKKILNAMDSHVLRLVAGKIAGVSSPAPANHIQELMAYLRNNGYADEARFVDEAVGYYREQNKKNAPEPAPRISEKQPVPQRDGQKQKSSSPWGMRSVAAAGVLLVGWGLYKIIQRRVELSRDRNRRSAKSYNLPRGRNNYRYRNKTWKDKLRDIFFSMVLFSTIVFSSFSAITPADAATPFAQAPPAVTEQLPAEIQSARADGLLNAVNSALAREGRAQLTGTGILRSDTRKKRLEVGFVEQSARDRVEQVNLYLEKLRDKLAQNGQLYTVIKHRGNSDEARTIEKAELLLLITEPDAYRILRSRNTSIYMANIAGMGWTTGSRYGGLAGKPIMALHSVLIDDPTFTAIAEDHEISHIEDMPEGLFGLLAQHNILTFFEKITTSGLISNEVKAYSRQEEFIKKHLKIEPKSGTHFVDFEQLAQGYEGYKRVMTLIDFFLGMMLNVLPVGFILWRIIKGIMGKRGSASATRRYSDSYSDRQNRWNNQARSRGNIFGRIINALFSRGNSSRKTIAVNRQTTSRVYSPYRRPGLIRRFFGRGTNRNRYRSIILVPILYGLANALVPGTASAAVSGAAAAAGAVTALPGLLGVVFGILAIAVPLILMVNGIRKLSPENLLKEHSQADLRLKRYPDDPTLEQARGYALDAMTASAERRALVRYHNEFHVNGLLLFFDKIAPYLPLHAESRARTEQLARFAIFTHDLGYFDAEVENPLLADGHENKSKKKAREFMSGFKENFSERDIQIVEYFIEKTVLKIGDIFKEEVAADNRAYMLLEELDAGRRLSGEDRGFLEQYRVKNFPAADLSDTNDRIAVMDAIIGGKVMVEADLFGLDNSPEIGGGQSVYPEMIVFLSEEFRYDKNILEEQGDIEAVKRNPATATDLEQVGGSVEFQSFVRANRLNHVREAPGYPQLSIKTWLKAEQEAAIKSGHPETSLMEHMTAITQPLAEVLGAIQDITGGKQSVVSDESPAVEVLKRFIQRGVALGLYSDSFAGHLRNEIGELIARGNSRYAKTIAARSETSDSRTRINAALQQSAYWTMLTPEDIRTIDESVIIHDLWEGDFILKEGETDDRGVFIVISGECEVYYRDGLGFRSVENTLKPGDIFGEMAVMNNTARTATVRAGHGYDPGEVKVAEIPRQVFQDIFRRNGNFNKYLNTLVRARKDNNALSPAAADVPVRPIKERNERPALDAAIGNLLDGIIAEHNQDISSDGREKKMTGFKILESADKYIQDAYSTATSYGEGIQGKPWARVMIIFEDGTEKEFVFKAEGAYARDDTGYEILKRLGISVPGTRRYGNNLFLIETIGRYNLGEISPQECRNPEFVRTLARLAGRAAARAFALGITDRKNENVRIILDETGMPKDVINIDLSGAFQLGKAGQEKAAIVESMGILIDMLNTMANAGVSEEQRADVIELFIAGFELQIYDFQNGYPVFKNIFDDIDAEQYKYTNGRQWILLDNVKAQGGNFLARINPETLKREDLKARVMMSLVNRIGIDRFGSRQPVIFDRIFGVNGMLRQYIDNLLKSTAISDTTKQMVLTSLFDDFAFAGGQLLRRKTYDQVLVCVDFCAKIFNALENKAQFRSKMFVVSTDRDKALQALGMDDMTRQSLPLYQVSIDSVNARLVGGAI